MKLQKIIDIITKPKMQPEEQSRILRKNRGELLSNIHNRQQVLDKIDYILHKQEEVRRKNEN